MTGRVRVGTAAWKKPTWRGVFYPAGLPQRLELEYASSRLSTLEINATFHGEQRPTTFARWRNETPDDFVFAVKAHKLVPALYRAVGSAQRIDDFVATGLRELGGRLGPLLWQFPPGLAFDPRAFEGFLRVLPADLRHCVEARDPTFQNPRFLDLLSEFRVAVAFTNDLAAPIFRTATTDFAYLRLSADEERYRDGYDDESLDRWADDIRSLAESADVFAYFTHPNDLGAHTPFDAMRLQKRLGSIYSAS